MSSSAQDRVLLQEMLSGREPLQEALLAWKEGTALEEALRRLRLLDPGEGTVNDDATGIHVSAGAGAPPNLTFTERYRKVRSHAKGGLGEVFVAHDEELDREVALKEIQEQHADDAASQERFVREARLTGQLEHPGIVPVYGLGTYPDGRPYYAMRFIGGEPLSEAIQRYHALKPSDRPLALRQLLGRFMAVCNAVGYAHSHGVIHRDLKPANIILGEFGETLVVDWGLAKASGGRQPPVDGETETAPSNGTIGVLGTPAYMSPEQASGDNTRVGPASDVYALGATLYQILTGRASISPGELREMLRKVVRRESPTPRQVNANVPRALEAVVLKAMAAQPEERYATAQDLAAEVERWLADEPVKADREPWVDRARRWGRKHRTLVTSAVVFLLVGIIGLSGGVYAVATEQRKTAVERDNAVEAREEARDNLKQAEANLALAKKAVNETFDLAKEHPLLQRPEMKEVKKLLFEKALPFYQAFPRRKPDNRADRAALAEQYHRVGCITEEIGRKAESLAAFRQAEIHQKLVEERPDVPRYRRGLARTLDNMGNLFQGEGRGAEALAAHRRARDIERKLVAEYPAVPDYQRDLATTLNNLGVLLRDEGKRDDAIAAFRQARDILAKLAGRHPGGSEDQVGLAGVLSNLSNLLREEGRWAKAREALTKALNIRENRARDWPDDWANRRALANTLHNLGMLYEAQGKGPAALEAYGRARDIFRGLANAQPAAADYRNSLALTLNNMGNVLKDEGKPAEAMKNYAESRTIREKLVKDHPTVVRYQCDLALILNNTGALLQAEGKRGEALTFFSRARDINQKLVKARPGVSEYQCDLARTLNNIGTVLNEDGKGTEALQPSTRAREIMEKLVKAHPAVTEYQSELAATLTGLGVVLYRAGKHTEALTVWTRARDIREKLAKGPPAVPTQQNNLATVLTNIAILLRADGKRSEAIEVWTQTRAVRRQMVKARPEVISFRLELARCCFSRGLVCQEVGRLKEALADFSESIVQLQHLLKEQPRFLAARQGLFFGTYHRALTLGRLKRHRDALPDWDRAIVLAPPSNRLFYRKGRADCLARAGQYSKAIGEAEQLPKLAKLPDDWLYDLACVAALCDAAARGDLGRPLPWRERFADRSARQAVAWLQAAHKAGFFKTEANRKHLSKDTDLDSLRQRADFKAFVAGLTPKKDE